MDKYVIEIFGEKSLLDNVRKNINLAIADNICDLGSVKFTVIENYKEPPQISIKRSRLKISD